MEDEKNLIDFVRKYSKLKCQKLQAKYKIRAVLRLESIENGELNKVFENILEPECDNRLFCSNGHEIEMKAGEYYCDCGVISPQGTTSTSSKFDIHRYKNLSPSYDTSRLKQLLAEANSNE